MNEPLRTQSSSRRSGFSLMEIVIAISVMAILAGVVAFRSASVVEKSKATRITQIAENLKKACAMYHLDTGSYAHEYSGYPTAHRQLSASQSTTGWSGPYLETPLTANANPFGGTAHVYSAVTANSWVSGFDLDGDGTEDVTGPANMLYMNNVEQKDAQRIDDTLDSGIGGNWYDTGRVRWVSGGKRLLILLYQ